MRRIKRMSRIKVLEEKLRQQIEMYNKRFEQLECDHDIEYVEDSWVFGSVYSEQCSKCGKYFRDLKEQEYLELKLKQGKEQCASDRKELETRLVAVKKENGEG